MRRVKMWLMIAAMLASAATAALAQGPPPGPPPLDRIAAALGLNDQQKAAWETARQTFWTTTKPLHEQARALHAEIEGLLSQGSPDPTVIGQKTIALHGLRQQIRAAHDAMDSTIASMLTDEQKVKLDAIKAARPGQRGHFPGGPPPPKS